MRINKFLAESGVASRRAADRLIEDGAVKINGKILYSGSAAVDAHFVPKRKSISPISLIAGIPEITR